MIQRTMCTMLGVMLVSVAVPVMGAIRITEWMYAGGNGEFVELTNVGAIPIDMTGWSYDDDSRLPGVLDLSPFGIVQPGESVVFVESTEADFRAAWGLPISVKVLGEYTNNLGRADEINIFDAGDSLVDRLTYGDNTAVGGPRTQNQSGNPLAGALGANDAMLWVLAFGGDSYGSYASSGGDIANPGIFNPVPEPAGLALAALGGLVVLSFRRRSIVVG